jgi:hypothetical protein
MENEKRDRDQALKNERERSERLLENEKRDRQIENERRDRLVEKKDLEQKMELMQIQAVMENKKRDQQIDNEKRDRQIENEKRDRQIENEKRDRQIENERRDLEQKMELMKIQASMENEKRDRMLEKKEAQHQIEQLKWEVHFGQMEQQHASQPRYSQPVLTNPIQHMIDPRPALPMQTDQGETEQRLLQQKEKEQSHPLPPAHAVQPAPQESIATQPAHLSARLQDPNMTSSKNSARTTTALAALPSVRQGSAGSTAPPAEKPQASSRSKQEQRRRRQSIAAQSGSRPPSKTVQQQHTGPITKGGSVPLPGNALTHFFLSHCQSTGGDQTNAIYLELRQMGFSCW